MTKADYCRDLATYHARWCGRFSLAGLACFAASFFAIPERRGMIALAAGYMFYAFAARERRRFRQVSQ